MSEAKEKEPRDSSTTETRPLRESSDSNTSSHSPPSRASQPPPHTIFTDTEKYFLVWLTSGISIWSSLGSPIYYPALQTIRDHFNISTELVNISIVVYMIFQGIAPSIFAPIADKFGRRPVLLVCLSGFVGSSIGLALVKNYTGLLILRCIQSSFISPSVSISSGVVGDFTTRANRGGFLLLYNAITFIGQAFGALVGSVLIQLWDWRAIFWFLALGGFVTFLFVLVLLPETKRSIVGNGTVRPPSLANTAVIITIPAIKRKWRLDNPDTDTLEPMVSLDFFASMKLLIRPELAICLLNSSVHFAIWVVCLTCLTITLADGPYNYSVLKIGICYIPGGIGGLMGAFLAGRVLDYVYRIQFKHHNERIDQGLIPKDTKFNIVKARVIVLIPFALLAELFAIMYGWCLDYHIHIAAVLVAEFLVCLGSLALIGIISSLLIDLYPYNSSAATSSVNLTRCLSGALFVGVLNAMKNSMTLGGLFTFLGALGFACTLFLYVPLRWGMIWAERRDKSKKNA